MSREDLAWVYFEYQGHPHRVTQWGEEGILIQRMGWVDHASTSHVEKVVYSYPKDQEGIEFANLVRTGWSAYQEESAEWAFVPAKQREQS